MRKTQKVMFLTQKTQQVMLLVQKLKKSALDATISESHFFLTQKVIILTTDDNLTRWARTGLEFFVHRKSPGRQPHRPGLAQWLGPRPWERAVPVRFPLGSLCLNPSTTSRFRAKTSKTPRLGLPNLKKLFWGADDKMTRGARPGPVFLVHARSEWEAGAQGWD